MSDFIGWLEEMSAEGAVIEKESEKTVLKEIVVDHYFYIMEGVFEKGSFPHIFSKDEIEKNFRLDYELNCFENIVKWWDFYCRNHDATCEYMTCTAVLSNGNKYLIYASALAWG